MRRVERKISPGDKPDPDSTSNAVSLMMSSMANIQIHHWSACRSGPLGFRLLVHVWVAALEAHWRACIDGASAAVLGRRLIAKSSGASNCLASGVDARRFGGAALQRGREEGIFESFAAKSLWRSLFPLHTLPLFFVIRIHIRAKP